MKINRSRIYCTGFAFIFCVSALCMESNKPNSISANLDEGMECYDNLSKYSQLKKNADLYLTFNNMNSITVGMDCSKDKLEFDIQSLKKYILENVKSRYLVYMLFSKGVFAKYSEEEKEHEIKFWENYFAEFGFKRLILEYATSVMGCSISVDKIMTPGTSQAQTKRLASILLYQPSPVEKIKSKAFEQNRKNAEQGLADAQYALGLCYAKGEGVVIDMAEAVKWYRKAAEQGLAVAQCELGDSVQDKAEAVKWYHKAAEQGFTRAQVSLGSCYQYGSGVKSDITEAERWYQEAAKNGCEWAQKRLKKLNELFQLRKDAENGDKKAQYELGCCYDNRDGVARDEAEAVKWWHKAAEQGYPEAQFDLGCYYMNDKNDEAVKWWKKAAENGHEEAQYTLGLHYYKGDGVIQDKTEAVKWWRKAAENNHKGAQYELGSCYYHGISVVEDKAAAVKWWRKAAEDGNTDAQYWLGFCCENGIGVIADKAEAMKWYRKAARWNPEAHTALKRL